MNLKTIYLLLIFYVPFTACTTKVKKQEVVYTYALKDSEIFNWNKVQSFENDAKNFGLKEGFSTVDLANQFEYKGDSLEKLDVSKTLYLFKRALSVNPTEARYTKLAEYSMEQKNYRLAFQCYSLLENYNSKYKYQKILVSLISSDSNYEMDYSFSELEQDSTGMLKRLLDDELIKKDTTILNPLKNFETFLKLDSDSVKKFNIFCAAFKDTSSNITVSEKDLLNFRYNTFMGEGPNYSLENPYLYKKFILENKEVKFFEINFKNNFKINDSVIAVIYKVDTSETACPREFRHIYHRIMTYTKDGKLLGNKILASQSGEQLGSYTINNKVIKVNNYKRVWRNGYQKSNFDNVLIRTEKIDDKKYMIEENGNIAPLETIPN